MPKEITETPVLDLLGRMTADSLEASSLDAESLMLVRIAALVAVDAPPASYLLNLGAAGDVGIGEEQVRGVLAASHRSSARPASPPRQGTSCARWASRSRSRSSKRRKKPTSRQSIGSPRADGPRGAGRKVEALPTARPRPVGTSPALCRRRMQEGSVGPFRRGSAWRIVRQAGENGRREVPLPRSIHERTRPIGSCADVGERGSRDRRADRRHVGLARLLCADVAPRPRTARLVPRGGRDPARRDGLAPRPDVDDRRAGHPRCDPGHRRPSWRRSNVAGSHEPPAPRSCCSSCSRSRS